MSLMIRLVCAIAILGVALAQNYSTGNAVGKVLVAKSPAPRKKMECESSKPEQTPSSAVLAIDIAHDVAISAPVTRSNFTIPALPLLTPLNGRDESYDIKLDSRIFQFHNPTTFKPQPSSTDTVRATPVCGVVRTTASLGPLPGPGGWPAFWGAGFGFGFGEPDPQTPPAAPSTFGGTVRDEHNNGVAANIILAGIRRGQDRLVRIASTTSQPNGAFNMARDPQLLQGYNQFFLKAVRPGATSASLLLDGSDLLPGIELQLGPPDLGFDPVRIAPVSDTRSILFHAKLIQNLPLSGSRNTNDLVLLAPGVFPAPETSGLVGPGISPGVGTSGLFSVNGIRSRENNFVLDGSANNDEAAGVLRTGFVFVAPLPVETITELQVLAAFVDSSFGHNIGAQVNLLSASGPNSFHGTAYGYLTDRRWNARNFFDAAPSSSPVALNTAAGNAPVLLNGAPLLLDNPVPKDPAFTRTQTGIVFGGPLDAGHGHDPRTFALFTFESQITHAARQTHFAVPTVAERGYLKQGESGFASVQGNAIFSLYPFPNNPVGPYGRNTYTQVLPADSDGRLYSTRLDRYLHAFGANNTITARFTAANESSSLPDPGGALFASMRPSVHTRNFASFFNSSFPRQVANTFRFDWGRAALDFSEERSPLLLPSSMFPNEPFLLNRPLLLNTGRSGFISGGSLLNGLNRTEDITGPVGRVDVASFSPLGADGSHFPQRQANSTFQLADTVTWVLGRHILLFGFETWRFLQDSSVQPNQRPEFSYYGQVQRASLDPFGLSPQGSILLDAASVVATGQTPSVRQTLGAAPDPILRLHRQQFHFFVHDDFRLPFNLSFNLGFRVEHSRLPQSSDGRFDMVPGFNLHCGNQSQTNNTRFSIFQAGPYCDAVLRTITSAYSPGFQKVFDASQSSVKFRFGLSWSPGSGARSALRIGFGSHVGQFPGIILDESRSIFPRFVPISYSALVSSGISIPNIANPAFGAKIVQPDTLNLLQPAAAANPFGLVVLALASGGGALQAIQPAPGLRGPSSTQMGITFERRISDGAVLSVAYVGTHGRDLLRITGGGLDGLRNFMVVAIVPPTGTPGIPNFPSFPSFNVAFNSSVPPPKTGLSRVLFDSGASSDFHSLQAELRGRFGKRFQFGTAFTFSHSIDDASDFFDTAGNFALPQDDLHRSERGSSAFDQRLRSATHFLWDLPEGRRWYARGWELSGIGIAQSGQPFTVNSAFDINQDALLTDRLDSTKGLLGPAIGRPVDGLDRRTRLLAPGVNAVDLLSLFGRQTAGAPCITSASTANPCDGAVGRNTFRAGGLYNLDLAVSKAFSFHERYRMLWRLEAFNALNHAGFGIPVRILEAPAFGQAVRTILPNRTLQIAGRFDF